MSDPLEWAELLMLIGLSGAVALGRWWLPGYLTEKGKNLATKEDIKEITHKVETIKASLGADLHIHTVRYECEFQILRQLAEKTVALRDAALRLRPVSYYSDSSRSPDDEKRERGIAYNKAASELYMLVETTSPFYPERIRQAATGLLDQCHYELVAYRFQDARPDVDHLAKALENAEKIKVCATDVLVAIRERSCRWEKFDEMILPQ